MDQEEIRDKIKKAIKAKLTELGSYIDDELPDYIMVMIANKKDTAQMSSDLDLFLGDNAQPFTDWLNKLLVRLQSVAKSVTLAPDVSSEQPANVSPHSSSTNVKVQKREVPQQQVVTAAEPTMLTLHAQEDDEVVFDDDDNDDPVETSKPILAKPVSKPVARREPVSQPQTEVQELEAKPSASALRSEREVPSDLLARKRMISTRGDSGAWIPKARVQPSRRAQMPPETTDTARPAREPSPSKSSPTDRRQRQEVERRHSRDRSPVHRASASSRLGNRGDSRDSRGTRDYERQRDAPVRERREDYRLRDDRRDDYRPRYLDRTSDRFYDRYKPRRPMWQADTRGRSSRDASPVSAGLSSQIGSAVPRVDLVSDSSDDEYNPDAPQIGSVASIIKISERKSSIPKALQANKKLLLKAMADVTKSLATPAVEEDIIEVKEGTTKKPPAKKRIGSVIHSPSDGKRTRRPVAERLHTRAPDLRRKLPRSRSRSRSRSPARSRLLEEYDEEDLVEVLELLEKKRQRSRGDGDVRKRVGVRNQDYEYQQEEMELNVRINESGEGMPDRPSPKFVVTLDGVDDMSISKNLDDEEDTEHGGEVEELKAEEDPSMVDLSAVAVDTSTVPCRYLPYCKAGDACPYLHPICKNLNNCRFGTACKYKHPKPSATVMCKFDGACTRPACPYTHSNQDQRLTNSGLVPPHPNVKAPMPGKPVSKIVCRFHPKCTNLDCKYLHPKPCKFGISCVMRNSGCMFTHPSLPTKDQLKWRKSATEETVE